MLLATSLAIATDYGQASIFASGPQGFSESLYAYLSQANNNGSAFAGYTGYFQPEPGTSAPTASRSPTCSAARRCCFARFIPIVFTLAIAGALIRKRVSPAGLGTMRTDTPTFGGLVVFTVVLVGALTFLPALLLGPAVQGLTDAAVLTHEEEPDLLSPRRRSPSRCCCGIAYPLVVTGISQVAFGEKADGDPNLIAHDVKGSPRYFQPRPSATDWSASATFFANRGPEPVQRPVLLPRPARGVPKLEGPTTPA